MVNIEKVVTRQLIKQWHERVRIDYSDLYINLFLVSNKVRFLPWTDDAGLYASRPTGTACV